MVTPSMFGDYCHYYLSVNLNLNVLQWGTLFLPFTFPVSTISLRLPILLTCLAPRYLSL